MPNQRLEFVAAARAIVGARSNQEDAAAVWRRPVPLSRGALEAHGDGEQLFLAVVADGMGGHANGEIASSLAVARFVRTFEQGADPIATLLGHAMIASNDAINTAVRHNQSLSGMGCTLVAAVFNDEGLRWSSVGDSALLLVRDGRLQRLNRDHSYGALLDARASRDEISAEAARNDPRRSELRSALIGLPVPETDLHGEAFPLRAGDWVILASDGIETLSHAEIEAVINRSALEAPAGMVENILGAVGGLRMPNQDNTTTIAVKVIDAAAAQVVSPTEVTAAIATRQPGLGAPIGDVFKGWPAALAVSGSLLAVGAVVYYSLSG